MGFVSTATFRKSKACPSADALMRYGVAVDQEAGTSGQISAHLEACDFCAAELQLLVKYLPTGPPTRSLSNMPPHLHRLAQALFAPSLFRLASGEDAETDCARDSLTLTDA
ncbi:MAG: hypothetical protein ACRD9R_16265 [Pyrinomonadaceae bacterium]